MAKLLKAKDILMLGLAGALDLFEEFRDPFGFVSYSYENLYGFVPGNYRKKNFAHLVWRNLKTNCIEKVVKDGKVYLKLTPQGSSKITRDFPLISSKDKKWDRKWRLVFFDISETHKIQRDDLREKLKKLGFGMLQKSIFITPHDFISDLMEFLESIHLIEFVYVVEVSNSSIMGKDMRTVANKIWNISGLNEKYREILEELIDMRVTHLKTSSDRAKILNTQMDKNEGKRNRKEEDDKRDFKRRFDKVQNKYLNLILEDPMLPLELLPKDWLREKVAQSLKDLRLI